MRKFTVFERRKRIYAACISTLLFLMAQCGTALSADYWLPVEGTDCKVWSDEPMAKGETIRWSGGCKEGKLSGNSVLEVFEGHKRMLRFEGTMLAGKAEGPGKLEIEMKDGTERYEGGFAKSLFDGYGVYELADGSRYEGGFRNDKPDGFGVYKGADGDIYQGEIKNGEPHGRGFRIWPDGEQYEGAFVKGKQQGTGTLLFPNGDVYEGQFKDDKADRAGKFTAANGEVFKGQWRDGKAEGTFTVTKPDGSREEQVWKNDQRVN
jgi:hypothetical protein